MTPGEKKRAAIFDKYSKHLNHLIYLGILSDKYKDKYICPLCDKVHDHIYEDDPLSLEDAPPNALAGNANILTCTSCNNIAGTQIDAHLVNRMKELEERRLKPTTQTDVLVNINGNALRGTLNVDEKGDMFIRHSNARNHPKKLKEGMAHLKKGDVVTPEFVSQHVIPARIEPAILKTGYLIAFEKLGYTTILHPIYDSIKSQIKNPEKNLYPSNFWFKVPSEYDCGLYLIIEKSYRSLISIFEVELDDFKRKFGVIIPVPGTSLDNINKIYNKVRQLKSTTFKSHKIDGCNFLFETKALAWLYYQLIR